MTRPPRCTCGPNRSRFIKESPDGLQSLEKYAFAPPAQQVLPGNAIQRAPAKPERTFPFMRLYPELRHVIYELHFSQAKKPGTIGEFCDAGDQCPNRVYNNFIPIRIIILVSKQIYAEAMPLYYRSKRFQFNNVSRLDTFLKTIGPRQARHVHHISFTYSGLGASQAFWRLGRCISLRTLHIVIEDTREERVATLMKKIGISALLRSVRGVETVTVDVSNCPESTDYTTFVKLLGLLKWPRRAMLPSTLEARLRGM